MSCVNIFLHRSRGASGFVLVASLLMLLLVSILTVSMGKNTGLQELITGNHREKTRALQSAEAALNYAELWLNQASNNSPPPHSICSSFIIDKPVAPKVCDNPLLTPTILPWTSTGVVGGPQVGVTYSPPNMPDPEITGGVGTYYAYPVFYIQFIGISSTTAGNMYKITAYGYGGDKTSIAMVQSIFSF